MCAYIHIVHVCVGMCARALCAYMGLCACICTCIHMPLCRYVCLGMYIHRHMCICILAHTSHHVKWPGLIPTHQVHLAVKAEVGSGPEKQAGLAHHLGVPEICETQGFGVQG